MVMMIEKLCIRICVLLWAMSFATQNTISRYKSPENPPIKGANSTRVEKISGIIITIKNYCEMIFLN